MTLRDGLVVRPFTTLLIANRGEIALRVIRAARAAGLRTVAVYSDADATAAHVRAAHTAVRLGPTPATQSYLSTEALLHACAVSGADAVHPGYGFLSERASFAQAVSDAGLVFVGPPAAVMEVMGRKDSARSIAERAGVPVVPTFDDVAPIPQDAYPVMVKAAAGGGGKGMRVVRAPGDLDAALAAARREAAGAFGDDTLLVETYVEHGRHVEVQVMADSHGTVLHLLERDCSVQRRHQKVLEEAPAPTISDQLRAQLHESAVALAREVGYVGAGTVEFLVDGERAYFLEMNTRLQVEHPVTEAVTGLDLVDLQLRVAAGEPLPLTQDDVMCSGHAIEARVYAEDVPAGFLPAAGRADVVRWPAGARVDAALEAGQLVGTAYDPMLGKIITHGPTREAARMALLGALEETAVIGLTTNLGFLHRMVASDAFASSDVHTAWLDSDPAAAAVTALPALPDEVLALAAWEVARRGHDPASPFGAGDGWRLAGRPAATPVRLWHGDSLLTVPVDPGGSVRLPGGSLTLTDVDDGRVAVNGEVHHVLARIGPRAVDVVWQGQTWTLERAVAGAHAADPAGAADVAAPMPGTVRAVEVALGESVAAGQTLGVLEAMKMELALKAPHEGTVTAVARVGEQVPLGQLLFRVDPLEEA
jgi:acetyl/propionyl-CoA carboxylase alpha subunit